MQYHRKRISNKETSLLQPLFVEYLAIVILYVTRVLGITTFVCERRENPQRQRQCQTGALRIPRKRHQHWLRLRLSRRLRWYSITVLILIATSTPFALYTLYTQMQFLALTSLLAIVGNMRYVLIEAIAVTVTLWNSFNERRLVLFLNRWLHLQYALDALSRHLNIRGRFLARLRCLDRRSCVLFCSKILLLTHAPVYMVYVIHRENALQRPKLLIALLFNYSCSILLQVNMIMYSGCALRVAHYGKQINELLQYALAEARQHLDGLHPLNEHRRNRVFCLCKVINRLHCLHARNLQLSRELVQIYSPSLLLYFFYVLVLCTVQLFVVYFLTCSRNAGAFRWNGESAKDKCSSPNFFGPISVAFMLADICVLVWGTHLMQARLNATRFFLAEGSVELPLPRRICDNKCCEFQLEAALAEFALYLRMVYQQQHKHRRRYFYFMVCGLFALDRRLIFVIFETILNYLIILIQYDKVT